MNRIALAALLAWSACSWVAADEPQRITLFEGTLHLGDNPEKFPNTPSAGMLVQFPCKLSADKKGRLTITTRDIQTLAGDGHCADLLAHYEDGEGPAREYVVQTFRLKGDANDADADHPFDFDPMKDLYQKPAYYSVRIRIDTQIRFLLWDDFLLKRIEVVQ